MRHRPLIMGVLNVTPDSFSDGGLYFQPDEAKQRAEALVQQGADILDIGGESTRPGAHPVSLQQEMDRVLPIVEAVASGLAVSVSVDTTKFEVAREAVRLGATIVNDVSGGADLRLAGLPAGVNYILMHSRGTALDMRTRTEYPAGVVAEVKQFLADRVRAFKEAGVSPEHLWVDPGIGFAKRPDQSLELLRRLEEFQGLGSRLVVGTSRKSFLSDSIEQREPGTIASNLWAYTHGASVFRVHDVGAFRRALSTWEAIENAG